MDVQTAVVQNALDVCQLFKDNVALNRDLPPPGRLKIDSVSLPREPLAVNVKLETTQPLAQATATAPVTTAPITPAGPAQQTPTQPAAPATANYSWLWPAAIAAGTALAGAGGLAGVYAWLNRETTTVIEQPDPYLLEYLQEKGYHLPPNGGPTR